MLGWAPVARLSVFALVFLACGGRGTAGGPDAGTAGVELAPSPGTPDLPIHGASVEQARAFRAGDELFEQLFESVDGLGPVYVRPSCTACHLRGGRGPGQTQRMAVVSSTTGSPVTPVPFGSLVRPLVTAGAVTPVLPPDGGLPDGAVLQLTTRVAAPVFGRAYLEAIADSEIERVAAEQALRSDDIHGRVHRVSFHSQGSIDPRFLRTSRARWGSSDASA
jgi:hypothetical protein